MVERKKYNGPDQLSGWAVLARQAARLLDWQ